MAREISHGSTGIGDQRLIWAVLVAAFLLFGACNRSSPPAKPPGAGAGSGEVSGKDQAAPAGESTSENQAHAEAGTGQEASVASSEGKQLFAQHCAACHGDLGDGKGVAARFLFPKPRDFRTGRFRLVSTKNRVPSREDLEAVLIRGMPGSAMPPWAHLSKQQRQSLIDEVVRLWRAGQRDLYIKTLREDEELSDDEIAQADVQKEIQEFVDRRTTPGEITEVSKIGEPTPEAIARGKEAYIKQSCHSCHGKEGRGDGQQKMVDDNGLPTLPRDFIRGIFKGDPDPASLYRRIAYGMPGTPMPSSEKLSPEQIVDIVYFVRSLSSEEARQASVLKREQLVAQRVAQLPDSADAEVWANVKPMALRMTPLWWRNDFDPQKDTLDIQAIHDGKSIALRMSWRDETENQHAMTSQSFEDAVAVELYRAPSSGPQANLGEPFIGMGNSKSPLDVWYWDADRQNAGFVEEKEYPNTVVDRYPFSENAVATAEYRRPGTETAKQPELSLPAKASGNPIVPPAGGPAASHLTVGGPGSVTFRPPLSQLVKAHGQWKDGRWTVVMTRSLEASGPQDGVSLEPGCHVSVAFARWDGAHRDRDGQKSITIWQDLELQK